MQLNDYERYSAPSRKGAYFFFSRNRAAESERAVHPEGLDGAPEVLIDPNTWSADGTGPELFAPSKDARYAVYGISRSGSDWQQFKVMELATKTTLDDTVDWVKVSGVAWHGDGFFYSRYPEPPPGHEKASINENHQVFFHKLGTPQSAGRARLRGCREPAALPRRRTRPKTNASRSSRSPSAARARMATRCSCAISPNPEQRRSPAARPGDHERHVQRRRQRRRQAARATNHGAPNWRVVLDRSSATGGGELADGAGGAARAAAERATGGGKLFATYLKDVTTRAYVYSLDGKLENEIALPGPGAAAGFGGEHDDDVRVLYVQLAERAADDLPLRHCHADERRVPRAASAWIRLRRLRDEAGVLPEQGRDARFRCSWCTGRASQLDGNNPTLLYGYGGFNIVLTPTFSAARLALLERGVVYASANLRGGGEYGEAWHQQGMKRAQAERLRRLHRGGRVADRAEVHVAGEAGDPGRIERRTARRRRDESAAGAVPRRDCAGRRDGHAAVSEVHDRLELDRRLWLERRPGRVQAPCYAYSPLHNIRPGANYPATLITTADHDDRVVPAHSFKYAATLQSLASPERPVLIRIETRSGHGASNLTKQLETIADVYAFVLYNLAGS